MKLKDSLIIFMCVLAIQSCKNDIEINAPWKETPVVNGFLDINTTHQFIRITKTFQNASNLTPQQAAQISDSLYFDSLIVKVIDLSDTTKQYYFYKKDTMNKDAGFFAYDKNYLYYCENMPINIDQFTLSYHDYKLFIYNPKSGKTYTSQTSIVGATSIMPDNPNPVQHPYTLDIYFKPNTNTLDPTNYLQFNWKEAQKAVIYTALIRYNYTEYNIQKYTDQYITINEETVFRYFFLSSQMNQYLINIFGLRDVIHHPSDTLVFRKITEVDYIVLAGGNDLRTAVDLSKPNTSLLQVKPDFSNITGGLGLFTSRSTTILKVPFDPTTSYSSERNLTVNVKGFAQP